MKRHRRIALSLATLLCFAYSSNAQDNNQDDKDFYADIASKSISTQMDRPMEIIPPVDYPLYPLLEWSGNSSYYYERTHKLSTQKEIETELKSLRKRYAPFIKDIAPKMKEKRTSFRVEKMQFRYETEEDLKNFQGLVEGNGSWTLIDMPYYHGPQGISTAWYRQEISIPSEIMSMPSVYLHFNGSDYYTDAYINGHHVGYHEGMLDEFEFDIKPYLKSGKNILLIRVRNDYSMLGGEGVPRRWGNKLSASNCPGWDDPMSGWSCCPTGYGVYQDVYIEGRSVPFISDIFCRPLINENAVELWTEVDLPNGELADSLIMKYSLHGQNFQETVVESSIEKIAVEGGRVLKKIRIDIPQSKMRLWSPDTPWLYQMQVSLYDKNGNKLLDNVKRQFGMREFVIDKNSTPKGRMYLNGKEIRLRGTNTMGFLQLDVMRHDWEQLEKDLLLAKLTNMNFIRTTQRIVQKEVYEMADRVGMMMQADLPLFAYINQKQYTEILKQSSGIERVLRNHPSVILMSYLNEPMAEVKPHAISRYAYERLFDALDITVHNENPDRAVKYIDGDYQPPSNGFPDNHCYNIWYDEHGISLDSLERGGWMAVSKGWMYGCGEFGAEGLDPEDLMNRRYPVAWKLKKADGTWTPENLHGKHSGSQTWGKHWDWFETQSTMKDWISESWKHQEWGVKKVSRAFRRMPRMNSFAIHLFIDAWPNGWTKAIMDCERTAKSAWYSYRDALTPLSVQIVQERTQFYSGDKFYFPVWICNDTHSTPGSELRYVMELNGKCIDTGCFKANVPNVSEGAKYQGVIPVSFPDVDKKSDVRIRLALYDKNSGNILHEDIANLEVYPKICSTRHPDVYMLGSSNDANAVVNYFGMNEVLDISALSDNGIVMVSDSTISKKNFDRVIDIAQKGGTVVFFNSSLSKNTSELLNLKSDFKEDDSWIVFRNKDLKCFRGSSSTDLKYNYSSVSDRPERHYFKAFDKKESYIPVLTHKNRTIIGKCNKGKGQIIICGLKVNGKVDTTPLLTKVLLSFWKK